MEIPRQEGPNGSSRFGHHQMLRDKVRIATWRMFCEVPAICNSRRGPSKAPELAGLLGHTVHGSDVTTVRVDRRRPPPDPSHPSLADGGNARMFIALVPH